MGTKKTDAKQQERLAKLQALTDSTLTEEQQQDLLSCDEIVREDAESLAKRGQPLFRIQQLLSKPGKAGGFSRYLRDISMARSTAYSLIFEYRWSQVAADLKELAVNDKGEGVQDDENVRKLLVEQHEAGPANKKPEADLKAAIADATTEAEKKITSVRDAVETAVKAFVKVFEDDAKTLEKKMSTGRVYGRTPEQFARELSEELGGALMNAGLQTITRLNKKHPALVEKQLGLKLIYTEVNVKPQLPQAPA